MFVIESRNPHSALPAAIKALRANGIEEDTRNGPVLRMRTPVTTVYTHPLERLTFHDWRDDNPFFLNVEALWMLAGRDDLKQLTPFVAKMKDYSDDGGVTSPGAYGKRWRSWQPDCFNLPEIDTYWPDQLNWAVKRLAANHGDRRVVIQMWDPAIDIDRADNGGKDVPCNLTILPWIESRRLHLTVFNRSNDIIWGLYSANAVQFSTLLDYLSARIGVEPGTLTTVSNNFHGYLATLPDIRPDSIQLMSPYENHRVFSTRLMNGGRSESLVGERAEKIFQEDLAMLFEYGPAEVQLKARHWYLRGITAPLILAHQHWKNTRGLDRFDGAIEILGQLSDASDWGTAAKRWINRRKEAWLLKQEG